VFCGGETASALALRAIRIIRPGKIKQTMPRSLIAARERISIHSGVWGFVSTWLPVAIGLFIILGESTNTMSSDNTSHFLRPLFTRLFGPWTDAHWDLFHHILRKSGHFIGYGTLGMCWLRAWLRTFAARPWTAMQWRLRSAALGILGTFLTASADEYHQTFIPSRTGKFSDVLLDTCGAGLFTLVLAMLWRRQRVPGE
jgi:VanZ family protein